MIIDFHTHPLCRQTSITPAFQEAMDRLWAGNENSVAQKNVTASLEALLFQKDIDNIISEMDTNGIDISVITGMDLSGSFGIELVTLKDLETVTARYPNRFISFAGIDPSQGYKALEKAKEAATKYKCRGIKLHPELQNIDLSNREFNPLWQTCLEYDLIVWSHASVQKTLPGADARLAHPMMIEPLAVRFPQLKIVLGHCGFPWMMEALAMAYRHPNVYVDVSSHYAIYSHFPWQAFTEYGCEHKLLFATDSPFVAIDKTMNALAEVGLDEALHQKILGGNAMALLGL